MVAYYRICPDCGCYLDPGERCDCRDEMRRREQRTRRLFGMDERTGQIYIRLEEEYAKA